ncbi:MAG: hypothetical protein KDJ65_02285 [Anaerolineae bacterium]|nr:hypothetical protein [Anaerolineae bacterium]
MVIGKLVKSNAHIDYVCQVYHPGEVVQPPSPADYAFGNFVRIPLDSDGWLVGVIYDTILLNPEFGRLGPRLSSPAELAIFTPDYLNEKAVLVGVLVIGTIKETGEVDQSLPRLSARTESQVERMAEVQIRAFHLIKGNLSLTYLPRLLGYQPRLGLDLLRTLLRHLQQLIDEPQHQQVLDLLLDSLIWRHQVAPFGEGG